MRMRGYNVMFPMGFDAFGLPAENAAIQRKIHPKKWTYDNIEKMTDQIKSMGAMFDWQRETITSDPEILPLNRMVFHPALQTRTGVPENVASGLLPELQHHPGARTGMGR